MKFANQVDCWVENWNPEYLEKLIRDYHEFKAEGYIGACDLRTEAEELMKWMGIENCYATDFMEKIYVACLERLLHNQTHNIFFD